MRSTDVSPVSPIAAITDAGACSSVFDKVFRLAVEIPAASLVAAEIVILLAGVISRFVFHRPLIWSDELASSLFLWLALLGSVIALRRGEHMRMTAFVGRASPQARTFLDVLAISMPLVFLFVIATVGGQYAIGELPIITPALNISNSWRTAALPVGFALMITVCALRLWQLSSPRLIAAATLLTAVMIAVLMILRPVFMRLGDVNLLIFFVGIMGATIVVGVPIAFAFGLAAIGYLFLSTSTPLEVVVGRIDEGISHPILLSVPLFVFLGILTEMTGMARAMVAFLASLLGHIRGGLSYVLIGAMYLVSGISGSKAADMAVVAPVLFPEMKARGASGGDLVALLSASGAQTETVPPSLVLITIGSVTGVSIASLFTGGLLPALVLGAGLCLVVWLRHRNDRVAVKRAEFRVIGKSLLYAAPAIVLPVFIRFAVVKGIATAAEVSTVGIIYTIFAGLVIYRCFAWGRLMSMLVNTAALSGAILLIIGAATAVSWCLTQSGFAQELTDLVQNLPGGRGMFIFASIVMFVVLGSLLEGIPAIVLFAPLLYPISKAVGVQQVHYSMIVVLSMGLGLFCPPFGVGYYTACAIGRVNPDEGMRPIWGYMLALLIGLAAVAAFPWLSIGFLPKT